MTRMTYSSLRPTNNLIDITDLVYRRFWAVNVFFGPICRQPVSLSK